MFTVVVGVVAFFGQWTSQILQELMVEGLTVALSSRRLTRYGAFSDTRGARICHSAEEYVVFPRPRLESVFNLLRMLEFDNSTVGEDEHFELRHIWEAVSDWQVWLLSLINMSIITPGASCPSG